MNNAGAEVLLLLFLFLVIPAFIVLNYGTASEFSNPALPVSHLVVERPLEYTEFVYHGVKLYKTSYALGCGNSYYRGRFRGVSCDYLYFEEDTFMKLKEFLSENESLNIVFTRHEANPTKNYAGGEYLIYSINNLSKE